VEQVIRLRIYESVYWKEQCFALTGEHSQTLQRHYVTNPHFAGSGVAYRQRHRAQSYWRRIRQSTTDRVYLLASQIAPDPTREGDFSRVFACGRIQVRMESPHFLPVIQTPRHSAITPSIVIYVQP
jgi:PRP38 family